MDCHLEFNVIQNEMSLKMDYHLKWNVIKIGILLQNGMSLKIRNVTPNWMSLKIS